MLKNIKNEELYLKINGLTSMELEWIRPLLKSIFPLRFFTNIGKYKNW